MNWIAAFFLLVPSLWAGVLPPPLTFLPDCTDYSPPLFKKQDVVLADRRFWGHVEGYAYDGTVMVRTHKGRLLTFLESQLEKASRESPHWSGLETGEEITVALPSEMKGKLVAFFERQQMALVQKTNEEYFLIAIENVQ